MKNFINLGIITLFCLTTNVFADDVSSKDLKLAVERNNHERVLGFLDQNHRDEMSVNDLSILERFLISAVAEGEIDTVRALVEEGIDIEAQACAHYRDFLNPELPRCGIPLTIASYYNHVDIVWYLIEQGADIDAFDNVRHTPLIAATKVNSVRIADVFIRLGADVNFRSYRDTALEIALIEGHTYIERLLRQAGATEHTTDCENDYIPFNC